MMIAMCAGTRSAGIMSLCLGSDAASGGVMVPDWGPDTIDARSRSVMSDLENLLLLGLANLVCLVDILLGKDFELLVGTTLVVLGDLLLRHQALSRLEGIPADVSNRNLALLNVGMHLLDHLLASFFGQRRNGNADQLAVVVRGKA